MQEKYLSTRTTHKKAQAIDRDPHLCFIVDLHIASSTNFNLRRHTNEIVQEMALQAAPKPLPTAPPVPGLENSKKPEFEPAAVVHTTISRLHGSSYAVSCPLTSMDFINAILKNKTTSAGFRCIGRMMVAFSVHAETSILGRPSEGDIGVAVRHVVSVSLMALSKLLGTFIIYYIYNLICL